jgi:hypothetical protein
MISLHNILTVAKYEAKILRRSWLFRLFSMGAIFILTITNIAVISPIGDEEWSILAIPSSIPYFNLYLLNIGQALIIVFLAADFLKKDKKLDTNEVLYTRSMSNFEYIIGKSWGIVRLFLSINIAVLAIALIVNLIAKNTFIDLSSYLSYLLIVSVPTIIFSLGFAYVMMSLIKNQAITFLVLLGYAALDMFYLYFRAGSLFDYMLFGMPVFKSQITGFDDLPMLLMHRGFYTMIGLSFIFITILSFSRLPQSRAHRILTTILLFACLGGSAYTGLSFYSNHKSELEMRSNTIDLNKKYEGSQFLTVKRADLKIDHMGARIEGTANLICKNSFNVNLDEYVFSLNPELELKIVKLDGSVADFTRDGHVIIIKPNISLGAGETISIEFEYSGTINEAYCYPWYEGNIKEEDNRIGPVPVNQSQVFLDNDYVLLTPETHWYPVATLNYYPSNPARIKVDFTNYNLSVSTSEKLSVISQGVQSKDGDYSYFTGENPISGMSLIIGDYTSDSIVVDSMLFRAYYKPGNDFFKTDLSEIGDTLPLLISNIMDELETNFSTSYPYKSLTLVEVPIHFHSIEKKNTQTLAEVQPAMVLLPEKLADVDYGDFYVTLKRNKRRMERNNQVVTDKELQVRAFNNFIRQSFISGENFNFRSGSMLTEPSRFLLGPSYYFFKNNFYSNDYPVINAVFESHLQQVEATGARVFNSDGTLSESDKANTILTGISFNDLLALDPSNDSLRIVLTVKGDYIFNLLRNKAGIDEFNKWFSTYLENNKFRNIELEQFNIDLESKFGFSILDSFEKWFYDPAQPGFYFTSIKATEIVVDNRTRYLLSFDASNPKSTDGIFTVSTRTMGGGRGAGGGGFRPTQGDMGGQGRGMAPTEIDKIILLESMQSKRVNIILDAQPRAVTFNTLTSVNNPGEITVPVDELLQDSRLEAKEGEIILSRMPLFTEANEIIVDNEDPGFTYVEQISSGRLKKWLSITTEDRVDYRALNQWWAPEYWQKTVTSNYYGKFVKSAHYTRSGSGERTSKWTTSIEEPGFYDVYAYVQGQRRGPGGNQRGGNAGNRGGTDNSSRRGSSQKDLNFIINFDSESEQVTVDTENAETGWNHLGSYYISSDSSSVILTNLSEGRIVTADAIRWIKQIR